MKDGGWLTLLRRGRKIKGLGRRRIVLFGALDRQILTWKLSRKRFGKCLIIDEARITDGRCVIGYAPCCQTILLVDTVTLRIDFGVRLG